ncbi:LamG domain-containing protein [Patescibacteria group bacterium]|nr:MAG: LamG domain-containing protein [Patescibacteria group bacterium]
MSRKPSKNRWLHAVRGATMLSVFCVALWGALFAFPPLNKGGLGGVDVAHAAAPRQGLVGWWTMDSGDVSGITYYDKSGYKNHATSTGSPTVVAGKIKEAVNLNGSSQFLQAPGASFNFGTGNFTLSAWIKASTWNTISLILDKYNNGGASEMGFIFDTRNLGAGQKLLFYVGSGGIDVTGTTTLNANTWYHVAAVRNGDNAYVYVNGAQDGTASGLAARNAASSKNLQIGVENGGSYFPGSLDDVRVYNRALSAAEVKQLYQATKSNFTKAPVRKQLVGWWTMDSGDINGTKVYDKSGQQNHGTGTNITSADLVAGKIGNALNFDGSTEWITKSNPSFINDSQGAISFWAKRSNAYAAISTFVSIATNGVVDDALRWDYRGDSSKSFQIILTQNGALTLNMVTPNNTINDNNWHHIVFTSSGSAISVYVDNMSLPLTIYSGANSGQWFDDATDANLFMIGIFQEVSYIQPADFVFDDVRVYNRALSAAEVKQLYNAVKKKYSNSAPRRGLVGYWTMDSGDISGLNVWDKSGNRNHGTSANTPTKVAGKISGAMSFNGTSDYIEKTSPSFLTNQQGTVAFWTKMASLSADLALFSIAVPGSYDDELVFYFDKTNKRLEVWNRVNQALQGDVVTPSNSYQDTNWHQVVFISNGSAWSAYIDGISQTMTVNQVANPGNWFGDIVDATAMDIGVLRRASNLAYFNGSIDDVRVYNRALSAAEVKQLYNAAKTMYVK